MPREKRSNWGNLVEVEKRRRIRVCVAAYAYEVMNESVMSDHDYDRLSKQINVDQPTDDPVMDRWFKKHFRHYTGSWIHNHPNPHWLQYMVHQILDMQRKK